MKALQFSFRVGLICNLGFLLMIVFNQRNGVSHNLVISVVNAMGLLAIFVNAALFFTGILLFVLRKTFFHAIPAWLVTTNFTFFVAQIILLMR